MKTIFLHIGNFKTGTSAIQKYCHDARRELLQNGYDYIEAARPKSNPTNHGKLALSLLSEYETYIPAWYDETDAFEQVSAEVSRAINNSPVDNIIISSEEFYRIPSHNAASVECMQKALRNLFEGHHVKVVMYVRKPLDMLKSWYNQANKSNLPLRRFTDFFYYLNSSILLPQSNAHFWRECFGSKCLIIEPYCLSGDEHIQRFIELINPDTPMEVRSSQALVNQKRNEETLELDRICRIMLLKDKVEREVFLRNFVFENSANLKLLRKKIFYVNNMFDKFCTDEGLLFADASFNLTDLLVHEERVNRKDVVSTSTSRYRLAQIRNSQLTRFMKKIRSFYH